MKKLLLSALLLVSLFAQGAVCDDDDKNIVIENKKQTFLFKQDKGTNRLVIQENYVSELRCVNTRTSITNTEVYNDHETIEIDNPFALFPTLIFGTINKEVRYFILN